jgi:hypothetical protein
MGGSGREEGEIDVHSVGEGEGSKSNTEKREGSMRR